MTLESKNVNKKLNSLKISVTNKKIITMFPKDIKNQETITITPLFSGIKEKPEYFEEIISQAYRIKQPDKLTLLVLASFNWGSYIKIKPNMSFDKPLVILFENGQEDSLATNPSMNIIDIGDNTHITILLEDRSNFPCTNFTHLFIRVGSGSNVKILGVQNEDPEHQQVQSSLVHIYNDAHVNYLISHMSGKYSRVRNEFRLKGQGAELLEVDILRGQKEQLYDILSVISHEAPNTVGRTFARGVLSEKSKAVFKGIAAIPLEIPNCNSYLSLHGLLMDKTARFHTIPAMEIANSNVKAGHAATVSQIDAEQIFYFQSRGVDYDVSRKLISEGYIQPALSEFPDKLLQEKVAQIIKKHWYDMKSIELEALESEWDVTLNNIEEDS